MELLKQYQDNPSFRKSLSDRVFNLTYNTDGKYREFSTGAVPDNNGDTKE